MFDVGIYQYYHFKHTNQLSMVYQLNQIFIKIILINIYVKFVSCISWYYI